MYDPKRRLAIPVHIGAMEFYYLNGVCVGVCEAGGGIDKALEWIKDANGETLAELRKLLQAIPCQASGSMKSTEEGVETRLASSASSNPAHECPAPHVGDDIVRSTEKSVRGCKSPKDITRS